jgi:hypothetical protein
MERRISVAWDISLHNMELKYLSCIIMLALKQISESGTLVPPLGVYLISRVDWQHYSKWYFTKIDNLYFLKANISIWSDETTQDEISGGCGFFITDKACKVTKQNFVLPLCQIHCRNFIDTCVSR